MKKTYYEVLGVAKDADERTIKKAYRRLATAHHPDKHINATAEEKTVHEAAFKEATEAFEALDDPAKREYYDKHGCSNNETQVSPVEAKALAVWKTILTTKDHTLIKKIDVISEIKQLLLIEIAEEQEEQRKISKQIEIFTDQFTRYTKRNGGRNVFAQVITESIKGFEKNLESSKETVQLCMDTIAFVGAYSYRKDQEAQRSSSFTFLTEGGFSQGGFL